VTSQFCFHVADVLNKHCKTTAADFAVLLILSKYHACQKFFGGGAPLFFGDGSVGRFRLAVAAGFGG